MRILVRILVVVAFLAFCVYAYRDVTARRIDTFKSHDTQLTADNERLTKTVEGNAKTIANLNANVNSLKAAATQPAATQPTTQPSKE